MAGMNFPPVKYELVRLQGGLDQVTPTLSLASGIARRAANFECSINGGYTRIAGYERFDGKPSPSAAIYNLFLCTLTGPVAVGDEIAGMSTGAVGKVILVEGGSVVVTREVGTFIASEGIAVTGGQVGTIDEILGIAVDGLQDATYAALAANEYRGDIGQVPGSGPVRGVSYFKDTVYAWRNNEAGTALKMYESSPAGWVELDLGVTLAPGGRVVNVIGNVFGGPSGKRMYGADGANKGFEFDGENYVQITTGMGVDTPSQVAVHKSHLFFSFGASLQFSGIADAYVWSPVVGAGELAMTDVITNLIQLPGDQSSGALGVYTRSDTSILYGTSAEDFKLSSYNSGTGALAYTAQTMDQAYVMDDRGVLGLGTSLNFGNFVTATLTMNIRPFIQARRNLASASAVNREKGQYRVFFSDRNALYITIINGKLLGSMPVQFNCAVTCCVEGETPDGAETSFFGDDDGFVCRLDSGTSFDGAPIPANLNLVFNASGSPRILKRYRKASIEMTGDSYAEVSFGYDMAYGSNRVGQAVDAVYDNDLRSSYWDEMNWDNFVFDGVGVSPTEVDLQGTAENLSIRLSSVSALLQPFTVNSLLIHYSMRRGLR